MYIRNFINYTNESVDINDLGLTFTANSSGNLLGAGAGLNDLANSDDLIELLGEGISNYQIESDGIFYNQADGVKLITQYTGEPLDKNELLENFNLSWGEFKEKHSQNEFNMSYVNKDSKYYVYGKDETTRFVTTIDTVTNPSTGSDQYDFETNYKNNPNFEINKKLYGRTMVQSTPRPEGTTTYYTGRGDVGESVGAGPLFTITIPVSSSEEQLDFEFMEDVWAKDGWFGYENAPWGSTVSAVGFITHPVYGDIEVYGFLNDIPSYGTNYQGIYINSEDRGLIPEDYSGLKVKFRVKVKNSTAIPCDFKVWGFFEMYRTTTV